LLQAGVISSNNRPVDLCDPTDSLSARKCGKVNRIIDCNNKSALAEDAALITALRPSRRELPGFARLLSWQHACGHWERKAPFAGEKVRREYSAAHGPEPSYFPYR
jgi:hypothetical protein